MKHLVAGLAMSIGVALPAHAATVLNGSFENGSAGGAAGTYNGLNFEDLPGGGWDIFAGLQDWSAGPNGVEVQTSGTVGINAQDGSYYLELDTTTNSSIEQSVMLAAGSYILKFWYSPRTSDADTNGIGYTLGSLLDGEISGPSVRAGTSQGIWTEIQATFEVAVAGSYALGFFATGTGDGVGGFLDNVSIELDPTVSTVPVPAAGGLLLVAIGGLAMLRRRAA